MAKKSKGKKKGGKKVKQVPECLPMTKMSKKQLLKHIKRLLVEIEREKEERNFFMLEREKLFVLWNQCIEELKIMKDRTLLQEAALDANKAALLVENDLYNQKLRFLKGEQSKRLGLIRLLHLNQMRVIQDDIWAIEMIMRDGLLAKKKEVRKALLAKLEVLRATYLKHSQALTNMREKFSQELRVLETGFDRRLFDRKGVSDAAAELENKRMERMHDMYDAQLVKAHDKQLLGMKTFYDDLTLNNFAVLETLRDEIKELKNQSTRLKKDLYKHQNEFLKLAMPLKDVRDQEELWERDEVDIVSIEDLIARLMKRHAKNTHYEKMLECANEALLQKIKCVSMERDVLRRAYSRAVLERQRKLSMNKILSEVKLRAQYGGYGIGCDSLIDHYVAKMGPPETDPCKFQKKIKKVNMGVSRSISKECDPYTRFFGGPKVDFLSPKHSMTCGLNGSKDKESVKSEKEELLQLSNDIEDEIIKDFAEMKSILNSEMNQEEDNDEDYEDIEDSEYEDYEEVEVIEVENGNKEVTNGEEIV